MRSNKVGIVSIIMVLVLMLMLVATGFSKEATIPEVALKIIRDDQIKTFTLNELKAIPSYTAEGNLWRSRRGILTGPFEYTYTGIKMTDLLDLIGGITEGNVIKVIASDGYTKVFTYDQIKGKLTVLNRQGKPLEWSQPLTVILAYEETSQLIPITRGGPLRIGIVGPGNPITQGKFWVKWVERIEIEEVAPEKFTLTPDAVLTQPEGKLFEGKLVAEIKGEMPEAILIYGSTTGNTETLSGSVVKGLERGGVEVTVKNVVDADVNELADYDLIVFGCSTWWEGELQDDFVPFYHQMANISLKGKKAAVFGPGDKKNYPDTFCKAVDILEDRLKECGAQIVIEGFKVDGDVVAASEEAEVWGEKVAASVNG
jgi:flavodoxin I